MREATDLGISAGVRRELSGRRIDLSKLKFPVKAGVVTLQGEFRFVDAEKTADETAIELKFIESSLRSLPGVKDILADLTNWKKSETNAWEPINSDNTKATSSFPAIKSSGVTCSSCNCVIRFCPCCGKPLSEVSSLTHTRRVTSPRPAVKPRKSAVPPVKPRPATIKPAVKPIVTHPDDEMPATKPIKKVTTAKTTITSPASLSTDKPATPVITATSKPDIQPKTPVPTPSAPTTEPPVPPTKPVAPQPKTIPAQPTPAQPEIPAPQPTAPQPEIPAPEPVSPIAPQPEIPVAPRLPEVPEVPAAPPILPTTPESPAPQPTAPQPEIPAPEPVSPTAPQPEIPVAPPLPEVPEAPEAPAAQPILPTIPESPAPQPTEPTIPSTPMTSSQEQKSQLPEINFDDLLGLSQQQPSTPATPTGTTPQPDSSDFDLSSLDDLGDGLSQNAQQPSAPANLPTISPEITNKQPPQTVPDIDLSDFIQETPAANEPTTPLSAPEFPDFDDDTPLPLMKPKSPTVDQAEPGFPEFANDDTPLPPMKPAKPATNDPFAALFSDSELPSSPESVSESKDPFASLDLDILEIFPAESDNNPIATPPNAPPDTQTPADDNPFNFDNVIDLDLPVEDENPKKKPAKDPFNLDDFDLSKL